MTEDVEETLYQMMEGEPMSLYDLRTFLDSHGMAECWEAGVRAIARVERDCV